MDDGNLIAWSLGIAVPLLHLLGIASALDAVLHARTPQGSTAWVVALVAFPYLALPAYWVFGRSRFHGYVQAVRQFDAELDARLDDERGALAELAPPPVADARTASELRGFTSLARLPFTRGNRLRLLVDGDATFSAILAAIDRAEHYVLAQFYIIHDDGLGRDFQRRLLAAAARGVRVRLVYDGVGSQSLPRAYVRSLQDAGVEVHEFSGERGWLGRFRINFRNHRKIVVVDGRQAFVGGLNVGDEYLGLDPVMSPWRDTHLAVEGPAVQALQLSFVRDWYYGRGEIPDELRWEMLAAADSDQHAVVVASGPADTLETAGLLYSQAIAAAERRVWIASPYFVPDGAVLGALQSAALRGVDVRIIMPRMSDSWVFRFVPYAYLPEVERAGVRVFLYEAGFMHQKVILVDDDYAAVGTANFDNRSFRLNFEVTLLAHDAAFCADVEAMLTADLARSTRLTEADLEAHTLPFRLAVQGTRLLAPVL